MTKKAMAKAPRMTTISAKDRLFNDFFYCAFRSMERVAHLFQLDGVTAQVFGEGYFPNLAPEVDKAAKTRLRQNRAWHYLSELYDYAIDGVDRTGESGSASDGASSLVIDAGEVIALLTGEEDRPSQEWHDIVRMADGRFALGDGQPLDALRVALLANVDVRTVRNAISAGALITFKQGDDVLVENESARQWLMGRKGFKPTIEIGGTMRLLSAVVTPQEFGDFVRRQRTAMENPNQSLDTYPGLTEEVLMDAEAGVFRAPLNLVWPMADFYGVSREALLECVMRIYFSEALQTIADRIQRDGALARTVGSKQ